MSSTRFLTEDEIILALDEFPSDVDTPGESSSDDELQKEYSVVAGPSGLQNDVPHWEL